jgi:hypothetical protein
MENDLQVKYDSLCYATFLNVRHLTQDADRIVLEHVDWKNLEHRFVVHLIHACYGILGDREIAMDVNAFTRSIISRSCPTFGKIKKINESDTKKINVPELIEFMRGSACELCGVDFTFGDIYNTYYNVKDR